MSLPVSQVKAPDCQLNWQIIAQFLLVGDGDPEGAVPAPLGAIFLNRSGGASTTLYVKEADAGEATGWAAK